MWIKVRKAFIYFLSQLYIMSFTRFYDDDVRIKKRLEESLNAGLYHLDVPGNGVRVPFMEDPQIRLQKWGANMRTNTIAIDNDLRGLTRKLKMDKEDYRENVPYTSQQAYSDEPCFVDESRATVPAWTFRDKEIERWNYPLHNYQENTEIPFENNESTRIAEKQKYMRRVPAINGDPNNEYYLTGKSICLGGRC